MHLKHRRWLSHAVIWSYMFLSGLEYAIFFPTIWLYLQSLGIQATQTYWLGLTLAAMTFTDILSSLIVGRFVDQNRRIRLIVLGLNLFQLAGSLIYTFSPSAAVVLVGRLVAGCGHSITVVFLADICRSTRKEERTPLLLLYNICFQLGLLVGPSFNLMFQHVEVQVGVFSLTKLTAPGLIMFTLWIIFSLMFVTMYTDLAKLKSEELLTDQLDHGYMTSETMENVDIDSDSSVCEELPHEQEDEVDDAPKFAIGNGEDFLREGEHFNAILRSPLLREKVEENRSSSRFLDNPPPRLESPLASTSIGCQLPNIARLRKDSVVLARDCFRSGSYDSYGSMDTVDSGHSRWEYQRNPIHLLRRDKRKSEKFIHEAERIMGESFHSETDTDLLSRASNSIHSEYSDLTWTDYRTALVKKEILVLLLIRVIAFFCQTNFESIVPPVMNSIFEYDDIVTSYVYLASGLLLLVVYGILNLLSRCISDRALIQMGMILLLIALAWQAATIPTFNKGDRSPVIFFGVGAFLELVAIPVVADIGLALYSKMLPDNVQGVGHGVRRLFQQVAIMLGPLWGDSTLPVPLVLTLVPLFLQIVATIVYSASYKRMKPGDDEDREDEYTPLLS